MEKNVQEELKSLKADRLVGLKKPIPADPDFYFSQLPAKVLSKVEKKEVRIELWHYFSVGSSLAALFVIAFMLFGVNETKITPNAADVLAKATYDHYLDAMEEDVDALSDEELYQACLDNNIETISNSYDEYLLEEGIDEYMLDDLK